MRLHLIICSALLSANFVSGHHAPGHERTLPDREQPGVDEDPAVDAKPAEAPAADGNQIKLQQRHHAHAGPAPSQIAAGGGGGAQPGVAAQFAVMPYPVLYRAVPVYQPVVQYVPADDPTGRFINGGVSGNFGPLSAGVGGGLGGQGAGAGFNFGLGQGLGINAQAGIGQGYNVYGSSAGQASAPAYYNYYKPASYSPSYPTSTTYYSTSPPPAPRGAVVLGAAQQAPLPLVGYHQQQLLGAQRQQMAHFHYL